jgi:hypothetical protein
MSGKTMVSKMGQSMIDNSKLNTVVESCSGYEGKVLRIYQGNLKIKKQRKNILKFNLKISKDS